MAAQRTACCQHKGAEHECDSHGAKLGARCTIPGCGCPGWAGRAPRRTNAKRASELKAAGLENAEIRERLGVSVSTATGWRKRRS